MDDGLSEPAAKTNTFFVYFRHELSPHFTSAGCCLRIPLALKLYEGNATVNIAE